eukprot:403357066
MPVELTEPTASGATISVLAGTLLSLLMVYEVAKYITPKQTSELAVVNPTLYMNNYLSLYMDIDFHGTPCELISMAKSDTIGTDSRDIFKNRQPGTENIHKFILNHHDQATEEYKEQDNLDIKEVIKKLQKGLGCRIQGFLQVPKAQGSFTINTQGHNHDLSRELTVNNYRVDFSHKIRRLFFDDKSTMEELQNLSLTHDHKSLDGTIAMHPLMYGNIEIGFYSAYFIDVTPVIIREQGPEGSDKRSYMYTATHQNMLVQGGNQFNLKYDLAPICMIYTLEQKSFYSFIVGLCAVVGGFVTISSIFDSLMRNIHQGLEGKKIGVK